MAFQATFSPRCYGMKGQAKASQWIRWQALLPGVMVIFSIFARGLSTISKALRLWRSLGGQFAHEGV